MPVNTPHSTATPTSFSVVMLKRCLRGDEVVCERQSELMSSQWLLW
jgi:hypothetical protein